VGEDKFVLPLGVSIFFSFIKMIIILLLFRFLIFDLFVMITSVRGNYCQTTASEDRCEATTSGYRLKDSGTQKYMVGVDVLSFAFVIFAIFYFILFRKLLFKLRRYTRGDQFFDNNFTIMVEKIPPFFYNSDTPME
jgi:hypothetical protein